MAIWVFVTPPSLNELERRLRSRQQDSQAVIEQRMHRARDEMAHFAQSDYLVVNDDFARACEDLQHIIVSSRLKTVNQHKKYEKLLEDFG